MNQVVDAVPVGAARTWWARLVLAALLALGLAAVPAPGLAHGGDVAAELGTDGAGGVTVLLTWKNDGHPVEESAEVVVTGRSSAGEEVGPLTLFSASSGVGWYKSEPGELGPGHWTLEVDVTGPDELSASASVDVLPPPSAAPVADDQTDTDTDTGTTGADAAGAPTSSSDGWAGRGWMLAALLVAGAVAVVLILRARRARS